MNKRDAGNLATWRKNLAFARKNNQVVRIAFLETRIADLYTKHNLSTRTKLVEPDEKLDNDETDS